MATLARISFRWSLLSGAESAVATCSWFDATGPVSDLISAHNANQNGLWQDIRGLFHTGTSMLAATLQVLDITDGTVLETHELSGPTNPAGTAANGSLPLQIAEVLSIKTGQSGPSYRGRIYLPSVDRALLETTTRLNAGAQSLLVESFAAYFTAVQTASGFDLGVYSRTNASFAPATSINMGTVFDTMRSRRNELTETRYSVTI